MVLKGKLTFETEVKCHGDLFHEIFRDRPQDLLNISPNHAKGCDLHEGEKFGDSGSVYNWKYTLGGSGEARVLKTQVDVDEQQKSITFKGVEGNMFDSYIKEYQSTLQVVTDGDNHLLKWTIEYEKINEDAPEPIAYLELVINLTKDIEAHHYTK